jgi:3-oxoacyl-[acyl-carrier-protein] synthase II
MKRRVVVTGLGTVTALSCRTEELWTRLCDGESGVSAFSQYDCSRFRVRFGGEIADWSTDGYVTPKETKRLDRFTQFALVAAIDAVRESGIEFAGEKPFRCGVILGSGVGGLSEIEKQLRGPNTAVSTACASASNAIGDAFRAIQHGAADVMITGGTEAALTPMAISGFSAMRALSERNDDPTAASRPFDIDRDGFVLAEGAGVLVLEELEHAKSRGATIHAELLGYGASADGAHITQPDKDGVGAAEAMLLALADARLDPTEVDYINAHGTSTPLGDQAETTAIKTVYKEYARQVSISSTKSQLGHLLGASGGVEMIVAIFAILRGVIPPTINYETPDPACDLEYTPNQARERKVSIAMSNSFGFGGHNASLIVGRFA